jgi:hypothetical protein
VAANMRSQVACILGGHVTPYVSDISALQKKFEKFQKSINATDSSNIDPAILPILPVHHCMYI